MSTINTEKEVVIEELEQRIRRLGERVAAYQHTINHIDDFFEYTNESMSDRKFIHTQLDRLTKFLTQIK